MTRPIVTLVALLLLAPASIVAQEKSVNPGINKPFEKPKVAEWVARFEKEGRDLYDHRHEAVKACGIEPGMVVADIGAGTGLFTRLFSPLAGPTGKVYAVDISEEFVHHVERTCKAQGLDN
ncbi:MAG TPA: methyltransferase domain-containing protein, partial [Pirellulales bacterium]|nr:methyltransferase domain-containing protein [Pirellulales bacterium]